ncbi:MAG: universal stress protein [Aeoliella sp.]
MCDPILYVTDFSLNSQHALHYASLLASQAKAVLYIVHVSEALPTPDNPAPRYHTAPDIISAELSAKKQIEQLRATQPGVHCIRRILHGQPAQEIINFATENKVDLIVMGTHGRTGLVKLLMGSVAEAVVRGATCPVMVVKTPPSADVGKAI